MVSAVPSASSRSSPVRSGPDRLVWLLVAGGVIPLLVAVVAVAQYRWYPIGDLAQATLRQHSFWSDPPLLGPAGRISGHGQQGNHPGPAMFWATWPLWALLGRTTWAHQAATAAVSALVFVAVVIAVRRAVGWKPAAAVAVAGTVLMRSWGTGPLTHPWNPYVALVPFLAFAVLSWLAADGRPGLLPAAVVAGSFCIQSHVGYGPSIALTLAVVAALLMVDALRHHDDRVARGPAFPGPGSVAAWVGAAVAVGLVMWLPPLVDQWRNDPGNISILIETFRDQSGTTIGLVDGGRVLLTQLNPVGNWLWGSEHVVASPVPGLALLAGWLWSVGVAWRTRRRVLSRLNVVIATLLVTALYWAMRLDSVRLLYLVQWFWAITALLVLSVGWTVWTTLRTSGIGDDLRSRRPLAQLAFAALGLLVALNIVTFTIQAAGTEPSELRYSDTLAALSGPTADGLDPEMRYHLQWVDPNDLGGSGFGLLLELDSQGFDLGVPWPWSAAVEPHRVGDPADADRFLTVVTGDQNIGVARTLEGVEELAWHDHRDDAQRARYRELDLRARRELEAAGRPDLAEAIDRTIWIALNERELPDDAYRTLTEMLEMGQATAVFASDSPLPDLVSLR